MASFDTDEDLLEHLEVSGSSSPVLGPIDAIDHLTAARNGEVG